MRQSRWTTNLVRLPETERSEMRTKSFELEETVPGSFFFQGVAGGMLSGFIFITTISLWVGESHPGWVIPLTPVYMVMGAIVGVVKATFLWGTYRVTGLRMPAAARVLATTICIGLIAGFNYYRAGVTDHVQFTLGVGLVWLTALPVALLVGSRVKPWEFFTFGSIATSNGTRIGSRSVLATLGTLPLRLLSIYALVVWILTFVCVRYVKSTAIGDDKLFTVPLVYLLVSTYLTFRSPRKLFLLVIGILLNVPTAFLFYSSYQINFKDEWWGEQIPMVVNMSPIFLVAWVLFLVSRLWVGLRTRTVPVRRAPIVFYPHKESAHHCLGSRFSEWQERVAS